MTLSIGTTSSNTRSTLGTTLSSTHNNNGNGLVVVLSLRTEGATVSGVGVTFNSVAMTSEGSVANTTDSYREYVHIFSLGNPSSGSFSAAASWTGSAYGSIAVYSFLGCNWLDVCGTFASNTTDGLSISVNVTSKTGAIVVDGISWETASSAQNAEEDASQTAILDDTLTGPSSFLAFGSSSKAGAASVTMQWTKTGPDWGEVSIAGISVNPSTFVPGAVWL